MGVDAGNDLFKAVRAAITGDSWLATKVGHRVFSSWGNQNENPPLIRMKIVDVRPFEMDGAGIGSETDFWLHVYTHEESPIVCNQIAEAVRTTLDRSGLPLDGSDTISIEFRRTIMRQDEQSPSVQTAVVQFRAVTSAK